MANLIEKVRVYSAANGGHAANATTCGVTLAHYTDVLNGKQRISSQMATTMAPLIGVPASTLMREDSDVQFLTRKNSAP